MSYPIVKLGDVADFIRGITFKPTDVVPLDADDAVVCMRTKNVQTLLDCEDLLAVPSQFVRRKDQYLQEGDILVSSANSWNLVGKCCWIPRLPWRAAFGGFISVLRGEPSQVDRRYLYWWFASERVQALLRSFGQKTTNISNLNIDRCLQLDLPLPPLPEQRRIAAILDQADALRAKRREALAQLDRLAQSVFVEMFGDPVTNPRNWPRVKIADIGSVVTGNTPSRADASNYGDTIEWIKSDNINTPHYYLTRASEGLSEAGMKVGRTAPPNSILVTCIAGSPDCIGNSAMTDRKVAFNQQINAFLPRVGNPHFHYAQFVVGKKLIQRASTDGMKGMVSKGRFEEIEVPLPPEQLQNAFAERALAVVAMSNSYTRSFDQFDALFASLQHRAFRGEL